MLMSAYLLAHIHIKLGYKTILLKNRNEKSRRYNSSFGMFPTNQCLRADSLLCTRIYYRLITYIKLMSLKSIFHFRYKLLLCHNIFLETVIVITPSCHVVIFYKFKRHICPVTHKINRNFHILHIVKAYM